MCCRTYKIRSGSEKGWTWKRLVLWISVVDLTHQPAICYIICSLTALALTAFSSPVSLNGYLMICTFTRVKVPKYLALKSSCLNAYFPPAEVKTVSLYAYRSNMSPENSTANNHDFQMHCFEETTSCKACSMLLRYFCYSIIPPTS